MNSNVAQLLQQKPSLLLQQKPSLLLQQKPSLLLQQKPSLLLQQKPSLLLPTRRTRNENYSLQVTADATCLRGGWASDAHAQPSPQTVVVAGGAVPAAAAKSEGRCRSVRQPSRPPPP
ncbi:unnamed protein product [Lampetra planeri]